MKTNCERNSFNITDDNGFGMDLNAERMSTNRWPVIDSNGILFQNYFCARCHNIKNYKFLNANVTCFSLPAENVDILKSNGTNDCMIHFVHIAENFTQRFCKPNIDRCSPKWKGNFITKIRCYQGPNSYVYFGRNTYKNIYCAICNGEKVNFNENEKFCKDKSISRSFVIGKGKHFLHSLTFSNFYPLRFSP